VSARPRELPEPRVPPRLAWAAAGLVVTALAGIVYWGALRNGFVYDDIPQVVRNPWIRDPRNLLRAFTMGSWAYEGTTSNYFRPMMHVAYTATYMVFGLAPAGFHAVSIALHAGVSVLVLATSSIVLASGRRRSGEILALATVAGLLFASHPIHSEAVLWIGGVPDLCAAFFCLASFCAYASPTSTRVLSWRYAFSLAFFLVATLSKEIALVFPLVLASYDLAFRREAMGARRLAGRYLGFGLVGLVYLGLRFNALGGLAPVRRHGEIAGGAIVLNALPLFAGYLWKLVLPTDLTVFHAFRPVASWVEPAALASLAVAFGFALLGWWLWTRRAAGSFVAWAALLVPLLPALYIPGVGENPFAERYLYLPSVGFVWLLVMAAGSIRVLRVRLAVSACLILLLAFYAVAAAARVRVWNSDRTLWLDAVERSPSAPIAHYNLGAALFEEGRFDSATTEFEAAVRLEPSPVAWTSLGNAYREAGRPGDAVPAFLAALSMDPRLEGAYDGLGLAYVELGRPDAALEPLKAAVALAPGSPVALHSLAYAYERLGLIEAAIHGYEEALRADPSDAAARQRLTSLLRGHPSDIGHGPEGKGP